MPDFHRHLRLAQRGVTLVFALITLVALSLAAVALIRSVDGGTLILGNLGFKQDAQAAADDAARAAITWLSNNIASTNLRDNIVASGYYAAVNDNLDPTGTSSSSSRVLIDWDMNDCAGRSNAGCLDPVSTEMSLMGGQVTARYLIMRLCNGTGDPDTGGLHCARGLNSSGTGSGGGGGACLSYPNCFPTTTAAPGVYYRILVRAKGGRSTVAFTETLVHF